jgi:outer membrane protein TolC
MLRFNWLVNFPHSARRVSIRRMGMASTLAAAALTGCVNHQQEVDNYKKVLQGPKPLAVRDDYSHGEKLTLEAALLLANTGSEQLFIQGETYLQSLIARDRAYSTFMPTISLAPTMNWQNRRLTNGGAAVNTGATGVVTGTGTGTGSTGTGTTGTGTVTSGGGAHGYTSTNVPVAAHANLFNGFRDVATLQANQFNVKEQRYTLLNLQATVLLETAQTYYNVLLAERSVEVLSNTVKYQDALVQNEQNQMRVGIAQPLDVAQSEAQAAATRVQLITAQQSVQTNRAMLAFMTNARVETATLIDRLDVPDKIMSAGEAVKIAETQRLDVLAAAEAVRVQRQNLQAAIGEYYPSISLDLNYYLHRDSFPTNVEWAGIFTATVPIFSAGEIRADVRNAMSQLRVSLYAEWQLIRQIRENVQIDWENLNGSSLRIAELEVEVNASQEALRQAVQRYGVGLAINLDVLNAETQLLASQLSLAQERFNHKVFYLDLLRDTGRLPLPANLDSMSSGPSSQPTTQETSPIAPTVPGLMGTPGNLLPAPTAPTTQPSPATERSTSSQPASTEPTQPPIDFSLQPSLGPTTAPSTFPTTEPWLLPPSTQPLGFPGAGGRRRPR